MSEPVHRRNFFELLYMVDGMSNMRIYEIASGLQAGERACAYARADALFYMFRY